MPQSWSKGTETVTNPDTVEAKKFECRFAARRKKAQVNFQKAVKVVGGFEVEKKSIRNLGFLCLNLRARQPRL